MKVKNAGEVVVRMGDDFPLPRLQILNDDGTPFTGNHDVELEMIAATGVSTTLPGERVEPAEAIYEFTWADETDAVGTLRSIAHINTTTLVYGPSYFIYDPADLWVSPADVLALAGEGYTDSQAVIAIIYAQSLVRAWVSVPVQSPVPPPIAQATLVLATRALTSRAGTSGGDTSGVIVSESIADYTVRYANPLRTEGGMAMLLGPDVVVLLSPYHGSAYMVEIGPANPHNPLPISSGIYGSWWWGDAVIYDEEVEPYV